jgi:hypothetical protein
MYKTINQDYYLIDSVEIMEDYVQYSLIVHDCEIENMINYLHEIGCTVQEKNEFVVTMNGDEMNNFNIRYQERSTYINRPEAKSIIIYEMTEGNVEEVFNNLRFLDTKDPYLLSR